MTQITKELLREMRDDIDRALEEIGRQYGVVFKAGNARFTSSVATFKLEAATIDAEGSVVTKEADDFKMMAVMYGLKPEDLGREFWIGSRKYKLVGLKRSARAYPILAERDGQRFKLPAEAVRSAIASQG